MYHKSWLNSYQSVCSIQHIRGTDKIASGTGFIVDGHLVTNNHVFNCPDSDKVIIQFHEKDGSTIASSIELEKKDFADSLVEGSSEENWDFAILKIDGLEDVPSLVLCPVDKEILIGSPIALLGFQFSADYLSIHSGIVSSTFVKNNVDYIQVDASVNKGNSGGPLIDPESNEVIGIITRAAEGLTKMFDELIESFDNNIENLKNSTGGLSIMGIDPVEAFKVSQNQMKGISLEIRRSANVGIGYAFGLKEIRKALDNIKK